MKRRKSRDINVFNMSMLDVICSALGAFVILILMADFNRSDAVQTVEKLKAEIRHYSSSNKKIKKENEELEQENAQKGNVAKENQKLKKKVEDLEAEAAKNKSEKEKDAETREKLARAEEENRALKNEIEALKEKAGKGKGSQRDGFHTYGDWKNGASRIYLGGTKTTGSNRYGRCIEKLYTCRRTYENKWCAGPNGVSRSGGGGK